jgi:hypothetical protein
MIRAAEQELVTIGAFRQFNLSKIPSLPQKRDVNNSLYDFCFVKLFERRQTLSPFLALFSANFFHSYEMVKESHRIPPKSAQNGM